MRFYTRRAQRNRLFRDARRIANRLRRERALYAQALGILIAGQLEAADGRADSAIAAFADAARRFDTADMPMHAAVARIRHGDLVGGDEGKRLRAAGDAWMTREGVAQPARWVAMLAPGHPA